MFRETPSKAKVSNSETLPFPMSKREIVERTTERELLRCTKIGKGKEPYKGGLLNYAGVGKNYMR